MITKESQMYTTKLQTIIFYEDDGHRLSASDENLIDNHYQNDIRTTSSNLMNSVRGRSLQEGKTRNKGSPVRCQGLWSVDSWREELLRWRSKQNNSCRTRGINFSRVFLYLPSDPGSHTSTHETSFALLNMPSYAAERHTNTRYLKLDPYLSHKSCNLMNLRRGRLRLFSHPGHTKGWEDTDQTRRQGSESRQSRW